jgi:hypothetical protein
MSNEAISENILIREYTKELHSRNAAIFIGAGLSVGAGYVDWHGLLSELIVDLGLDPKDEQDLITVAQYHCNQSGGRGALTKLIFDKFSELRTPTQNHDLLASLPINTYWTTNYDRLIERALEKAKKIPDAKYTQQQLAVTKFERDAAIYKMHGDIEHADSAVISKDDYESYFTSRPGFITALKGDLVEKTFLFLGLSFTDPNIDYILSRVRIDYGSSLRTHYCILRKAKQGTSETTESFQRRELKQHYFIRDLKRFGIQTVLVDEYSDITRLLSEIARSFKRSSIFISGAAADYGTMSPSNAGQFIHSLAHALAAKKNRIITGFGWGVGSAVINGALQYLHEAGRTISDSDILMRPFPQVSTGAVSLAAEWTSYREQMIGHAGIAIFIFGNKLDPDGNIIPSNGIKEEFELCRRAGVSLIAIGSTGFIAKELWDTIMADFEAFYPAKSAEFKSEFEKLGDANLSQADLIESIVKIVKEIQRS